MRKDWGRWFEVVDYRYGALHDFQDLVVCGQEIKAIMFNPHDHGVFAAKGTRLIQTFRQFTISDKNLVSYRHEKITPTHQLTRSRANGAPLQSATPILR